MSRPEAVCADCGALCELHPRRRPRCGSCSAKRRGRAARLRRVRPAVHQLLVLADHIRRYVEHDGPRQAFGVARYAGHAPIEDGLSRLERTLGALAEAQMVESLDYAAPVERETAPAPTAWAGLPAGAVGV